MFFILQKKTTFREHFGEHITDLKYLRQKVLFTKYTKNKMIPD